LDADEPPCERRYSYLSSVEKSVTLQSYKKTHKQTLTDIFTPCVSACVDTADIVFIIECEWTQTTVTEFCRKHVHSLIQTATVQ